MTKTEEVLISMLTENTGTAMCDSGGEPKYDENGKYIESSYGYGRNYERNKCRKFEDEIPSTLKFSIYKTDSETAKVDITVEYNLYHWLKEKIEYNEDLDTLFHGQFLEEVDKNNDKCWLELMEEFTEWLSSLDGELIDEYEDEDEEIGPEYGEQFGLYKQDKPLTVNSYNEENLLEQVIQFRYFTNEQGEFILLQIHGGADVRGGYTKPRIFSVNETEIFDYARGIIYCTGKDHHKTALEIKQSQEKQLTLPGIYVEQIDFECKYHWDTDDGYHWYEEGSCGSGYQQLETYEVKELKEEDDIWEPGKLCIEDGVGYCPICGAKLAASFY